jgi:hypothetical protein
MRTEGIGGEGREKGKILRKRRMKRKEEKRMKGEKMEEK